MKKPAPKMTPQRVTQSPIRLTKALPPQEFSKLIKHLSQFSVETIGMSVLMTLLIEKGVISQVEVQQRFLDEVEQRGL